MISRWKLLLQAAFLAGWAGLALSQSSDLRNAAELVMKRDFGAAEVLIEKILKTQPTSAEALNLKGLITAEKGDLEAAKFFFDKALKENPKLAGAYVNLGYLYQRQGQPQLALKSFQSAAELIPGDAEALLNAAVILADGKQYQEAAQALSKVPEKNRTTRHWEVLGRVHVTLGDYAEAEREFGKVLEKEPESVETLRSLSGLALRRDDVKAAWDYIARARRSAPNSAQILYEFGQISMAANYVREAILAFRRALMMDDTKPEYYSGIVLALLMTFDYPQAMEYIEKYIQMRPDDGWGYYIKGRLLFFTGKPDEAVPNLVRALGMGPNQVNPLHYLGRIASDLGDNDSAMEYFRRALESSPDHAPTHLRLGIVYLRLRDYDAAERELRRAAELEPTDPTVHLQLGILLSNTGRPEDAAKEAELYRKMKIEEDKRKTDGVAIAPYSNPVKK
jgi:tetratricopeptide (TPR) repeat protein